MITVPLRELSRAVWRASRRQRNWRINGQKTTFVVTAVLLGLAQQGCNSLDADTSRPPSADAYPSSEVADSLIYATRELCVPYVVDGVSGASLTRRPGILVRHYNVHGLDFDAYELDRPGSPEVTLHHVSAPNDDCTIRLDRRLPREELAIIQDFDRRLRLDGRATSQPHAVEIPGEITTGPHYLVALTCVHGAVDAAIRTSNPDAHSAGGIEVEVSSEHSTVAAEGCARAKTLQ